MAATHQPATATRPHKSASDDVHSDNDEEAPNPRRGPPPPPAAAVKATPAPKANLSHNEKATTPQSTATCLLKLYKKRAQYKPS